MKKNFALLLLLLTASACSPAPIIPTSAGSSPTPLPSGMALYTEPDGEYFFLYPADGVFSWSSGEYPLPRIDFPFQADTTLQEKFLIINSLAGDCSGEFPDYESTEAVFNGVEFLVQSGTDAGAKNTQHNWERYTTTNGTRCVSLYFVFEHRDDGAPEFDEAAERAVIEQILSTFTWTKHE